MMVEKNACGSSIAEAEVNLIFFFRRAKHVQFGAINCNTCDYFFAVYKILFFFFSKLRSKGTFDKVCGTLSKFYAYATMKAIVQ